MSEKCNRGFADRSKRAYGHHGGTKAMTAVQLRAYCRKYGAKHLSASQISTAKRRGYL